MDNPIKCKNMIQRVAGTVVLLGLALAWFVHPWFVAVTAFAGLISCRAVSPGSVRLSGSCRRARQTRPATSPPKRLSDGPEVRTDNE